MRTTKTVQEARRRQPRLGNPLPHPSETQTMDMATTALALQITALVFHPTSKTMTGSTVVTALFTCGRGTPVLCVDSSPLSRTASLPGRFNA